MSITGSATLFITVLIKHSPRHGAIPPWYLVSHRHICPIPHFATYLGISLAIYRSQKAFSLGNSEKSLKRGSRGLSAPGSKKARKRVENDYFSSFFRVFGSFSTSGHKKIRPLRLLLLKSVVLDWFMVSSCKFR